MSTIAILGAGPIGAAAAQRLASRGRIREVRLIDDAVDAARGKALDIQQSGAVDRFDTRVIAEGDPRAAAGAAAIVLADSIEQGEWDGDRGMTLLRQLAGAGTTAPIVFASAGQTALMETAAAALRLPAWRMAGSAPAALTSAVQAIAGIELNVASIELTVVGRPPAFVIGWSAASASGSLVIDRIPAHRLLALSASLTRLWPPGPLALGAAAARVAEGLLLGARTLLPVLTIVDGEFGVRHTAVTLPVELGRGRVLRHQVPSLSPQERTELVKTLTRAETR